MAGRPILTAPHFASLAIGSLCFVVLYAMANLILPHLSPPVGLLLFATIFVASGSLLGFVAQRSPIMHGVLLGAMTGVLAITYMAAVGGLGPLDIGSLLGSSPKALGWMAAPGIVLCSLGALIGDYVGRARRGL
jgi:hypothetical protein